MSEDDYIAKLDALWPNALGIEASSESIELADTAVNRYPNSSILWQKRANLILLGPKEMKHTLEDALSSYYAAYSLNPTNRALVQDIAHFHDAIRDDKIETRRWLGKLENLAE